MGNQLYSSMGRTKTLLCAVLALPVVSLADWTPILLPLPKGSGGIVTGGTSTTVYGSTISKGFGAVPVAIEWDLASLTMTGRHPKGAKSSQITAELEGRVAMTLGEGGTLTPYLVSDQERINMMPAGATSAYILDMDGDIQVGCGGSRGFTAPFLWRGSAESAVNLLPDGYVRGLARAVSGNTLVGECALPLVSRHAVKWSATDGRAVILHPPGAVSSYAHDIAGDTIAGGVTGTLAGGPRAVIWRPDGVIPLHPPYAKSSAAYATNGQIHAGSMTLGAREMACVWTGDDPNPINIGDFPVLKGANSTVMCMLPDKSMLGTARFGPRNLPVYWKYTAPSK
jgi:hypothetical protein